VGAFGHHVKLTSKGFFIAFQSFQCYCATVKGLDIVDVKFQSLVAISYNEFVFWGRHVHIALVPVMIRINEKQDIKEKGHTSRSVAVEHGLRFWSDFNCTSIQLGGLSELSSLIGRISTLLE
jgi:hypothetical protein